MSSLAVRDAITDAVKVLAAPWPTYDVSDYVTMQEIFASLTTEAVLIQYVIADDLVQSIGGEGNQGWSEDGTVVIHMVVPTGFASSPVIQKGDGIREGMRGRRLGADNDITVESMSPFVDFSTDSVGISGSVHGYASSLFYVRRTCG